MRRRLLGLAMVTLLVAGAGIALAAEAPPEEPVAATDGVVGEVADLPPFLTGDMPLPPGLAARDELPYGLAKKLDPDLPPPGLREGESADDESDESEAAESDAEESEPEEGLPPFLTGERPMPPGLAAKDTLPPGLQRKPDSGSGGPPGR